MIERTVSGSLLFGRVGRSDVETEKAEKENRLLAGLRGGADDDAVRGNRTAPRRREIKTVLSSISPSKSSRAAARRAALAGVSNVAPHWGRSLH
jgi:hypothetical protein